MARRKSSGKSLIEETHSENSSSQSSKVSLTLSERLSDATPSFNGKAIKILGASPNEVSTRLKPRKKLSKDLIALKTPQAKKENNFADIIREV